jgi:outer membrane lipoprotein-sorting protein
MVAILQCVVASAFLGALQAAAGVSEVDALLDRWQKAIGELHSFTCKFRQEKRVSFMRRPLVSSGSLKYLDRKLLWVTDTPSASFLSFDGKEARIYHPEFNTLEIYALGATAGAGGSASGLSKGGFPGFSGDFTEMRQQYAIEALPVEAGSKDHRLRMTHKDEALKKEVVAIEILLDEALGMKEWRLVRTNGDELKLAVTDFVPNAKLVPKDLAFDVPAGVKIVRVGADAPKSDGAKGGGK